MISCDGRLIGSLERLLVEKEGFDPHSVVVREDDDFTGRRFAPGSWYFHDEVLVPVANVVEATGDTIALDLTAVEVRRLRPYLSYRYRAADAAALGRTFIALGTGGVGIPNLDEVATKTSDELEMAAGENVMLGDSGRKLGHVREILINDGELLGIVLHPSGFFSHDLLIPVRFLARSDDLALFIDATEEDLANLKPTQT